MLTSLCLLFFNVASVSMLVKSTPLDSRWLGLHVTFLYALFSFLFLVLVLFFNLIYFVAHLNLIYSVSVYKGRSRRLPLQQCCLLSFFLSITVGYSIMFFMFQLFLLLGNVSYVYYTQLIFRLCFFSSSVVFNSFENSVLVYQVGLISSIS